ncbi:MAG: hypothetical protein R3B09_01695 [Nannocystaceae bacterium]
MSARPGISSLSERAARAERMWRIYSGGRIAAEARVEDREATLRVIRARTPGEAEYPSLVDASLVWLTLEVAAPTETIVTLKWQAEGGAQVMMSLSIPAEARPGFEAIARAIAFEAGLVEPPRIGHIDVGRGAWEQAGYAAEPRLCGTCPFARASNLDCPECRSVVMERKTFSQWSRARVAEGLRALDFDPDLASRVALEAEIVLSQIQAPMLSHQFFDEWGLRFGDGARELFESEDDLTIARDMIEAQTVQPWFRLPPAAERPRPRPLPPVLAEAALGAAARRKVRELVEAGVPRWQAERHAAASLTLRRLLAAEGELLGERLGAVARIHGALDRLTLAIGAEGEDPWIVEVATPLGRSVELRRGLGEDERTRLEAEVARTHRQLMDAVAAERRAMAEADDARAIALALENLRGSAVNGRE